MKATKRALIGRRIVDVDFRPFDNGRGETAHNPVLILDNGRRVYFVTEETEMADYGTLVCITSRDKPQPRVVVTTTGTETREHGAVHTVSGTELAAQGKWCEIHQAPKEDCECLDENKARG